jgi:hypothetical protein
MDDISLLQAFQELAEKLSIRVKYGRLDHEGGLCRYRGAYHIIINKRLDTRERIQVMSRALAEFPLDDIFLIPAIRESIDAHQKDLS